MANGYTDGGLLEEVGEVLGRLVEGVDVGAPGEELGVAHTPWRGTA